MIIENLEQATWLKREKRFLLHCQQESHEFIAHLPNTGPMLNCYAENDPVWLSKSDNPKRKYAHTAEIVDHNQEHILVNTHRSNSLVEEALLQKSLAPFKEFTHIKREVKWGESRIDFHLQNDHESMFLEVKNATYQIEKTVYFPDTKSDRATKHIKELCEIKKSGVRAGVLFVVSSQSARDITPARDFDPKYIKAIEEALKIGVEFFGFRLQWSLPEVKLVEEIPFRL